MLLQGAAPHPPPTLLLPPPSPPPPSLPSSLLPPPQVGIISPAQQLLDLRSGDPRSGQVTSDTERVETDQCTRPY